MKILNKKRIYSFLCLLSLLSAGFLFWILSAFEVQKAQEFYTAQSFSPWMFISSSKTWQMFYSYVPWVLLFGLLLSLSAIFFVSFIFKKLAPIEDFLSQFFLKPLNRDLKKQALLHLSHSENPTLQQLKEGFVSVLRAPKKEEEKVLPPAPLFSDLVTRLCRLSAKFYPDVSIKARLDSDLALPVFSSALFQALWELVKNSAEAFQKEGMTKEIRIHSFNKDHWFCCELQDKGPGMSNREKEKAFELYFSTKPGSAGLGLNVVQSVLAKIGGLAVLSDPQKHTGLKVSLFIPMDYMEHIQNLTKGEREKLLNV